MLKYGRALVEPVALLPLLFQATLEIVAGLIVRMVAFAASSIVDTYICFRENRSDDLERVLRLENPSTHEVWFCVAFYIPTITIPNCCLFKNGSGLSLI